MHDWYLRHGDRIGRFCGNLGLYPGEKLRSKLHDLLCKKLPELRDGKPITFARLQRAGCPTLKVLASNTVRRAGVVYSFVTTPHDSVIDAVFASACYPMVFQPVRMGSERLVDGGLSSNLPIFLFDQERQPENIPLYAFDLVTQQDAPHIPATTITGYVKELAATALDAHEDLVADLVRGVHRIRVPIMGVSAMDFKITGEQQRDLFTTGEIATKQYFESLPASGSDNLPLSIAARFGEPDPFNQVLEALCFDLSDCMNDRLPKNTVVRACVMLPTGRGKRIVVYEYGMTDDPDADLELEMEQGCTGQVWRDREPMFAILAGASPAQLKEDFGMSPEVQRRVRTGLSVMLAAPIFARPRTNEKNVTRGSERILGTVSADTNVPIADTNWLESYGTGWNMEREVRVLLRSWAKVLGQMLEAR